MPMDPEVFARYYSNKNTPQQQERFEITSGKYHAVPQPKDGNEQAERSLQGALTSNIIHHKLFSDPVH